MTKRRNTLDFLWQKYLGQASKISPETLAYVAALKARIDILEYDKAMLQGEVRRMNSRLTPMETKYGQSDGNESD